MELLAAIYGFWYFLITCTVLRVDCGEAVDRKVDGDMGFGMSNLRFCDYVYGMAVVDENINSGI